MPDSCIGVPWRGVDRGGSVRAQFYSFATGDAGTSVTVNVPAPAPTAPTAIVGHPQRLSGARDR
jgi:hypothetical protein